MRDLNIEPPPEKAADCTCGKCQCGLWGDDLVFYRHDRLCWECYIGTVCVPDAAKYLRESDAVELANLLDDDVTPARDYSEE